MFHDAFVQVAREVGAEISRECIHDLQTRIRMQRFDHEPLNEDYRRWKAGHGYDDRILIQTSQYLDSMRYWRLPNGDYMIGVRPSIHHSGLPMDVLARIHEFGSAAAHIPARAHWRPMRAVMNQRYRTEFSHLFMQQILSRVRRGLHP